MSIHNIPNVQFIDPSHRCHQYLLDFVVATSSIGSYLRVYHNQQATSFAPHIENGAPQYPTNSFEGKASKKNIDFIPDDLLRAVFLQSNRNTPIPYLISSTFNQITGSSTDAIAETFEGLAQAMFTGFWETNLAAIETSHGKRKGGKWPSVLQFAAVVRDTMSHGGTIHMFPSIPPAAHFGLTYSPADNGRKIIHNDLTCADIIFLMLEADAAF
ncbi:MAG: hypothetical protein J0H59_16255 [Comamonadaceae bacterium]|nr:hypothetical protein [Comamonadaceae bacterium]